MSFLKKYEDINNEIFQLTSQKRELIRGLFEKIDYENLGIYFEREQIHNDNNYYESISIKTINGMDCDEIPDEDIMPMLCKELKGMSRGNAIEYLEENEFHDDLVDIVESINSGKTDLNAFCEVAKLAELDVDASEVPSELLSK